MTTDTATVSKLDLGTAELAEAPERKLSVSEGLWVEFIVGLRPWEIHKLHAVGEMELHDEYVYGNMDLKDVFSQICIPGEEDHYLKKV